MKIERQRELINATRAGRGMFTRESCAVQANTYFFVLETNNLVDNPGDFQYIINILKA